MEENNQVMQNNAQENAYVNNVDIDTLNTLKD